MRKDSLAHDFAISFRLKTAYRANGFIFSLKSLPLIKRILPDSLYSSRGLKRLANIVSWIIEFNTLFLYKIAYFVLCVYLLSSEFDSAPNDSFAHILIFTTLVGALFNNTMFDASNDKYYAMFIMRMDAKRYTLSNYYYFLLKTFVGMMVMSLIFGSIAGNKWYVSAVLPLYVVVVKVIVTAQIVRFNANRDRKKYTMGLPYSFTVPITIVLLALAYAPSALGYAMPEIVLPILTAVLIPFAVYSLKYLSRFEEYKAIYRRVLSRDTMVVDTAAAGRAQQAQTLKAIDTSLTQTSTKTGYKYFNELFMKRHSKLLTKSAKLISLIEAGVFAVSAIICLLVPKSAQKTNELLLSTLPLFMFLMYFVNRGQSITQAMFMNCDHSMLTYRFYRQPRVIVSLFFERLKYVALINLIPAAVIAVGLPLLLLMTGGGDPINYVIMPISILAMSVFFSIHHLTLYYLLQPYNANLEMKNATYTILNIATYVICYAGMQVEVSTLWFGVGITAFSILYALVALPLVYKLAPKTFKLRN